MNICRTDEQLKKNIVDQLFWDDSIDASGVKVEVSNGKATLSGNVLKYSAKDAASSAAWLVNGIQDVDNRLQVQFPSNIPILTDEEIQRKAIEVLTWNADIHGLTISVSVTEGLVILDGTVASYWQRNKAKKLVSDILGVVDIINQLIVVPTELLTDQTVAENIQTALKNSPHIDGSAVKVSVKDGIVRLKGSVPTSHDRMQALIVVGNCRGVIDIINEIRVL
ncbi:MAG: BON domain-containing protein [Anaerolineales bacterium]